MNLLAVSGSARRDSTNTALLRAVASLAPPGFEICVHDGVGRLPVFSPDLDGEPPEAVRAWVDLVAGSDGLIVASPEYVRSLPGGVKNAIDWLVSRDTLVGKPIALLHASHRGDDMLETLRNVLATVSDRFAPDIFLRLPLMKMTPDEVAAFVATPEIAARVTSYLGDFRQYCER